MGVVAVGKQMERTTKYFLLATRILAELGAHIIKTYYCEDFDKSSSDLPCTYCGSWRKSFQKMKL